MTKLLVHLVSGPENPTRGALAFLVAKTAVAAGHEVACHWAEDIRAGRIQPQEREAVFEPGPVAAGAWEPPPT